MLARVRIVSRPDVFGRRRGLEEGLVGLVGAVVVAFVVVRWTQQQVAADFLNRVIYGILVGKRLHFPSPNFRKDTIKNVVDGGRDVLEGPGAAVKHVKEVASTSCFQIFCKFAMEILV